MPFRTPHRFHRLTRQVFLYIGLAICLAGCDALGAEETIILSDTEVEFRYSFEGGSISTSETNELHSNGTVSVNLNQILQDRGFALQDLRSVTVEEASLQMTFPVGQRLDFMEEVGIFLTANELSPTLIGRRMEIPGGRRSITVPVESTKNIEAYVRSAMRARIDLVADSELDDGEYEMDLTLDLTMEVGGL